MGAQGTDVLLSEKAFRNFPYSIECKAQEASKNIYDWYQQAVAQDAGEPLLIVRKNHSKPLAVIDAEYLLKVLTSGPKNDT